MARDMKARSLLGLGNGAGGLDSILPGSQYGQNRQGNALGKVSSITFFLVYE